MSNPGFIPQPFAANGSKNTIQNARQPGQSPEDATWAEGFPPITMTPMESGGLPPKGLDFNGVFYSLSEHLFHIEKGSRYQFDAAFASLIDGYPKGAILQDNAGLYEYISLIDGNTVDFNTDPVGSVGKWQKYLIDSPAFTGTPTAPTPAQSDNSQKLATTAFVQAALFGSKLQTYTANGTFVVPANVYTIYVSAVAGGGAGAGSGGVNASGGWSSSGGGGGGGAGEYCVLRAIPVTPGQVLTITIGGGGIGGPAGGISGSGQAGTAGGNTQITGAGVSLVLAGGLGGKPSLGASGSGVVSQPGSAGNQTAMPGGPAIAINSYGYDFGGIGGMGGNTPFGSGAGGGMSVYGQASTGGGANAYGYGSGGGGAGGTVTSTTATGQVGGAGAPGMMMVSW